MSAPAEAASPDQVFPLTFNLPDVFERIDLTSSPEIRADHLLDAIERNLPELSQEDRLRLVFANQHAVERMLLGGVIFAANFVGRSEVDRTAASTAQFSVLAVEGLGDSPRPLDVAAEALQKEDRNRDLQFTDLNIGRCLAIVEETVLHPATGIQGEDTTSARHVRQIQIMFPLTEQRKLAIFALSTECLQDWDDYVEMMAQICKTIRWKQQYIESSIAAALDGLR